MTEKPQKWLDNFVAKNRAKMIIFWVKSNTVLQWNCLGFQLHSLGMQSNNVTICTTDAFPALPPKTFRPEVWQILHSQDIFSVRHFNSHKSCRAFKCTTWLDFHHLCFRCLLSLTSLLETWDTKNIFWKVARSKLFYYYLSYYLRAHESNFL